MKRLLLLIPLLFLLGADEGTKINRVMLTKDGGIAVLMFADGAVAAGEVVSAVAGGALPNTVFASAIDSDMPLGVVYEGVGAKQPVWIVVAGVAYTLPNAADTPTISYIIYSSSTTAGRVSQSAALPSVTLHNREIGHWVETCAQGVICRAVLHFN